MDKNKIQVVGTEQKLKDSPRNVLPEFNKKPDAQLSGTQIKLQQDASSVKYGAGTKNGEMQLNGTKIPLSDKPFLGYQSYSTPMSERAIRSKKDF